MTTIRAAQGDRAAGGTDPLPRGGRGQADRLRPRLPGRRAPLGRGRRPRSPTASAASRRTGRWAPSRCAMKPDADLSPPGVAATIASLPRGARPRGRDDRRQRLRRRDVPGPGHPPPGADRPPRPDQLRHPRELPAGDLQGDAAAGEAAGRDGAARGAVPDRRRRPRAPSGPSPDTPIPAELIASWLEPGLHDRGVTRDLKKVTVGMNKRYTLEAAAEAARLRAADPARPGRRATSYFPISYAERLAAEAGNARIVEIPDAETFVPLDQPQRAGRGDRRSSRRRLRPQSEQAFPKFAKCRFFVRPGRESLRNPPTRTESYGQADLRPGPAQEHDGAAARRSLRRLR